MVSWETFIVSYIAVLITTTRSPGRFFVQQELKMIVAYLLLNYDIEPLAKRPQVTHFGMTPIPPVKATIRVKRKAKKSM